MAENVFRRCLAFLLAVLTGNLSLAAEETVRIAWLQDNLAPNSGFEEVTADGRMAKDWTAQIAPQSGVRVETDTTIFLKGRRSLKVSVPKSDTSVTVSSRPVSVEGGAAYLFTIAFRQEGFNSTGKADYGGVSAYAWGQWMDEKQQPIGSQFLLPFSYGPSPWDLRDAFERAPANARSVKFGVYVSNGSQRQTGKTIPSTVWVDNVQLRKYLPPVTPDWAKGEAARVVDGAAKETRVLSYFVGIDDVFNNMRGGTWSKIVADPQAERGTALWAPAHVGPGFMAHSPYWAALPAGLYRVRARAKIPPGKENTPVGFLDIDSLYAGIRQVLSFTPSRETAGKYADFEADFILRDSGWWDLRLYTYGKQPWSVDSLKVFCLHELEDRQLLAIYPGSEGEIPPELKPAPASSGKLKGLAVLGLGYDRFRIADVFRVLYPHAEIKPVWVKVDSGSTTFSGLPENPGDLFQYSIIYLCNVNLRALALKYKNGIREYVRRGGALVVMGGHQGFERGGWRGSLVEETLPVEAAPTLHGGLLCWPQGLPLKIDRNAHWLDAISTVSAPLVYYLHAATVKPSGQILVQAGDKPFLVTGSYGAGRVVCILGAAWGAPDPQATPFWQWDDWVDLIREVCWWAMKKPTALITENN